MILVKGEKFRVWNSNGLISIVCHSAMNVNHKSPDNQPHIAFEPNKKAQRKPHATFIFITFNYLRIFHIKVKLNSNIYIPEMKKEDIMTF